VARSPPPLPSRQPLITALAMRFDPPSHGLTANPHDRRDLDLRAAIADQLDGLPTERFLSGLRQRSSIAIHAPKSTDPDRYLLRWISKLLPAEK
jgi:hypothetical protein